MTVEEYIKNYTMNCSNELAYKDESGKSIYHPWLTPENAEAVAMIAREEAIKDACEWLRKTQPQAILPDTTIERFRKALE